MFAWVGDSSGTNETDDGNEDIYRFKLGSYHSHISFVHLKAEVG